MPNAAFSLLSVLFQLFQLFHNQQSYESYPHTHLQGGNWLREIQSLGHDSTASVTEAVKDIRLYLVEIGELTEEKPCPF